MYCDFMFTASSLSAGAASPPIGTIKIAQQRSNCPKLALRDGQLSLDKMRFLSTLMLVYRLVVERAAEQTLWWPPCQSGCHTSPTVLEEALVFGVYLSADASGQV
jgi:hypothetical protein